MKILISLLLGALLGASLFHLYYLRQLPAAKCKWDHPLDQSARAQCDSDSKFNGYAKSAREQLNDLIENVTR